MRPCLKSIPAYIEHNSRVKVGMHLEDNLLVSQLDNRQGIVTLNQLNKLIHDVKGQIEYFNKNYKIVVAIIKE